MVGQGRVSSQITFFKIIFSYVERNQEFAAQQISGTLSSPLSNHRYAPKRNYLFSRRLREDDISICDALLDTRSTDSSRRSYPHRSHRSKRPAKRSTASEFEATKKKLRNQSLERRTLSDENRLAGDSNATSRRKTTIGSNLPLNPNRFRAKTSLQTGVIMKTLDSDKLRSPSIAQPTTSTYSPAVIAPISQDHHHYSRAALPTVRRTLSGQVSVENGNGFYAPSVQPEMVGKQKFKAHQGKNKFCLNGRILMSEQNGAFYVTIGMIFTTITAFFIFDAVFIAERVSIALPVCAAILFFLVMANLLKTSFTDPGIIPRATNKEVIEQERLFKIETGNPSATTPRTRMIEIFNECVVQKYCFTCRIFRPPRASHCSVCDNCVLRFDHHCPWVGNCVGLRNYRNFYLFVVLLTILDFLVGACSIAHLIMLSMEQRNFVEAINKTPGSVFVSLVSIISVWSVVGLSCFHTYLLASNQTTNEEVKDTFSDLLGSYCGSLYSTGNLFTNCLGTLCAPEPPSLIDRRGKIEAVTVVQVQPESLESHKQIQSLLNQNPHRLGTSNSAPKMTVIPRRHSSTSVISSTSSSHHSEYSLNSYSSDQVHKAKDAPAELHQMSLESEDENVNYRDNLAIEKDDDQLENGNHVEVNVVGGKGDGGRNGSLQT
ncbi:unnamed protein product [Bursaphelenchus okinawaensis]|uniref:Palmitoyltransferase n=1 Tax=Bursaphelenchus okinawaensis TaxID=465554 RepID=A0A811JQR4_9BILA|nr:unnamed protein product [Bursaphelenchus okinawaensis]CAG9078571.1 unnamed protein product [Bursaphelenchus okinawaensis]